MQSFFLRPKGRIFVFSTFSTTIEPDEVNAEQVRGKGHRTWPSVNEGGLKKQTGGLRLKAVQFPPSPKNSASAEFFNA